VRVAAGSDYSRLGIAGVFQAGGLAAVGPAADATLMNGLTEAFIGAGAEVKARKDVQVVAYAAEDVLSVVGAVSGSVGFGIGGSLSVISLATQTHAYVNGLVTSEGNILIAATDDTDTDIVAGSAGLGLALGAGTSLGVTLINKDTAAWVGDGAVLNAKANAAADLQVFDGTIVSGSFPKKNLKASRSRRRRAKTSSR